MSERETLLRARHREAGFTLVEALIAVVILIFGLMGVTNLMIVAASSNSAANQGTAAATVASQVLERLKAVPFTGLTAGGDTATDTGSAGPCFGTGAVSVANPSTLNNCDADMQGVGRIHARWSLTGLGGNRQVYFVQVSAEATGGLGPGRTRAAFTTFRSCTGTVTQGCPLP
jgi:type II secretory pathway pseudopilin PulG